MKSELDGVKYSNIKRDDFSVLNTFKITKK